jgi:psiF repeat
MTMNKIVSAAFAALIFSAGAALADPAPTASTAKPAVTAAAPAKPVKMAKMHKSHKVHMAHKGHMGKGHGMFAFKSEKGKECSAQADTQGLHGKARRHFRHDCMKTPKVAKAASPSVKPATQASTVKPSTTTKTVTQAKLAKPAAPSTAH